MASCISLRKTRIFTICEAVSHPVSPSRSSPLPLIHWPLHCQSPRSQLNAKATGVGICTPPPASAITSHFPPSSTPPLVAEARSRYSLTRTSSSSSKRRGWKVKRPGLSRLSPCVSTRALPRSTPAAACKLLRLVCASVLVAAGSTSQQQQLLLIIAPLPARKACKPALIVRFLPTTSVRSGSHYLPSHTSEPDQIYEGETGRRQLLLHLTVAHPPRHHHPSHRRRLSSTPRRAHAFASPARALVPPHPPNTTITPPSVLHCLPTWTSEQANAVDWPASATLFPYT